MLIRLLAVLVLAFAGVPRTPAAPGPGQPPAARPADAPPIVEHWKGKLSLPGMTLDFSVSITRAKDGSTATLSIPAQSLNNAALADVIVSDEHMSFTLAMPQAPKESWAYFKIDRAADGKSATGTLSQGGAEVPLTMEPLAPGEQVGPKRPQTPLPPFPYAAREVAYENPGAGVRIAGTLTVPDQGTFGKGPHPAVLLITGSGPQDRDETLFNHRPFAVIADALTRAGIAVLRVDDRGVGGSTSPKLGLETDEDFTLDVLAGVDFLKTQPEIDPKRIGLLGHSEGGIIAPMAAARSADVAFLVLLAGTGVPGRDVLREQLIALARAAGTDEALIQRQAKAQAELFKVLLDDHGDDAALSAAIERLVRVQIGAGEDEKLDEQRAAQVAHLVGSQVQALKGPWFLHALTNDPREHLRKVRCPVLALNGARDCQVVPEQNLPAIRKALEEGGNKDITTEVVPGLNHLFQTCTTGAFGEYAQIEETIAPAVLETITAWVRERCAVGK